MPSAMSAYRSSVSRRAGAPPGSLASTVAASAARAANRRPCPGSGGPQSSGAGAGAPSGGW